MSALPIDNRPAVPRVLRKVVRALLAKAAAERAKGYGASARKLAVKAEALLSLIREQDQ